MEQLSQSIKVNSTEAERSLGQLAHLDQRRDPRQRRARSSARLLGVSAEVARSFVGKADEIASVAHAAHQRDDALLSDQSGGVLAAITEKGQQFAGEVTIATDQAIRVDRGEGLRLHPHDARQQQRNRPH